MTLNKMRRDHQDKVKQMEQEQAMLARMQMEQKLALLRQQKQEQLVFQQSLQSKRLEVLNSQRMEYQQKVALQREVERQQLIAQEQKVLQHQFGGGQQQQPQYHRGSSPQPVRKMEPATVAPQSVAMSQQFPMQADVQPPPPASMNFDPTSISLQSMSLHDPNQAPPLPVKLEYNPGMDPGTIAPPPYNPSATVMMGHDVPLHDPPPPASIYTTYQQPLPVSQQSSTISLQSGYSGQGNYDSTPQGPSMQGQLTSMQPSSLQQPPTQSTFSDFSSLGAGQPGPPNMGPPSTLGAGQPPPNMGPPPPALGAGQPSQMGPPPNLSAVQQMSGYSSSPNHQLGQPQPGPQLHATANSYTPLSVGQQFQQQDPPPPPQSYGAPGYQGYQAQYPQQQQQQAPGSYVPNGAHQGGIQRQESEPPLISFD